MGGDRHVMLDIGLAVPLGRDDAADADDRHGDPGNALFRHLGLDDRVDSSQVRRLGRGDFGAGAQDREDESGSPNR